MTALKNRKFDKGVRAREPMAWSEIPLEAEACIETKIPPKIPHKISESTSSVSAAATITG